MYEEETQRSRLNKQGRKQLEGSIHEVEKQKQNTKEANKYKNTGRKEAEIEGDTAEKEKDGDRRQDRMKDTKEKAKERLMYPEELEKMEKKETDMI